MTAQAAAHGSSPVILVTGASSGIGEASARLLAREPGASLVLVARRQERLAPLAAELGKATFLAIDLLDADAPRRVREHVEAEHGRLNVLVNNAGAAWRARFADGGYENVRRTMAINFDAQLRLTEELLPLLRRGAPSSIVNVASTAARVARAGTGAYSASKFALAGWSDSLAAEEREHGVHVGLVLPGFIATEGFPQAELIENPLTRRMVSTPDRAAEAIREVALRGRSERYVPRPYWLAAALRILAPSLTRRAVGGRGAAVMTTTTGADLAEREHGATPPEAVSPGAWEAPAPPSAPGPWESPGAGAGRSPLPPVDRGLGEES